MLKSGRGVAQPGLARHLGVVEVARSNRVAPTFAFWQQSQKELRGESRKQIILQTVACVMGVVDVLAVFFLPSAQSNNPRHFFPNT